MKAMRLACAFAVFGISGCGGSDSPTERSTPSPTPARAAIKVLLDPNPVTAVPSGDRDYPWAFQVNLQLSESGGVGFIVTSMQTSITAASTGEVWGVSTENPFVGQKIPALGQVTVQYQLASYRMDWAKTKEGTLNFKMNFVDDNGFPSTFDGGVRIQSFGEPVRLEK